MRWSENIAIGLFLLVALMEAFQGLIVDTYPWYQYVIHLFLVPLLYAVVAWLIMRGLARLFTHRGKSAEDRGA